MERAARMAARRGRAMRPRPGDGSSQSPSSPPPPPPPPPPSGNQAQQQQQQQFASQMRRSAFDWDIYKNRKTALQHLKKNRTLVDTILISEDGSRELVHSQVVSALSQRLARYIADNAELITPQHLSESFQLPSHISQRSVDGGLLSSSGASIPEQQPAPTSLSQTSQTDLPLPKAAPERELSSTGEEQQTTTTTTTTTTLAEWLASNQIYLYVGLNPVIPVSSASSSTSSAPSQLHAHSHDDHPCHEPPPQRPSPHADPTTSQQPVPSGHTFTSESPPSLLGSPSSGAHSHHHGLVGQSSQSQSQSKLQQQRSNQQQQQQQQQQQTNQDQQVSDRARPTEPLIARGGRLAMVRSGLKVVKLPMFNKHVLQLLVDCSYTGYIQTDHRGIWDVLRVADHYQMSDVIRACCSFLIDYINIENCIKYYHIGLKYNHHLYRHSYHMIKLNFKAILEVNEDLPSLMLGHFEQLLSNDQLNIDDEETVWYAIRRWCHYKFDERKGHVTKLLPYIRFGRLRSGPEFSDRVIWKDPLIEGDKFAQQTLALLDRNHRDYLIEWKLFRDGYSLPCAISPRQVRPRTPRAILLAIGGWQSGMPSAMIESYDINTNLWFKAKQLMSLSLAYHGIEIIDKLLYVCGGTDGSEILNELFVFDPVTGQCHQRASMREPRCYVSTAQLQGQLYAMGGHNGLQRMRSVERYDRQMNLWQPVADMNVARSDASACVYKQKIYIAGGLNDQVIEPSVEFFNAQDSTWTFIESMGSPRTSFTMLVYHDYLIAIGGNNGTERLSSVEQYNFQTKQWSLHSNMKNRRSTFSAALLDNRLVVVGGYNGQTPFNKVEMYDETQRQWQHIKSIKFDRSGLKVVVVQDLENAADYTFLGNALDTHDY